jgi:acyl carrier protein
MIGPAREVTEGVKRALLRSGVRPADVERLAPDYDLFRGGVVDSLALIRLIVALEKEFGIRVAPRDYEPMYFRTLGEIARLMERLKGE